MVCREEYVHLRVRAEAARRHFERPVRNRRNRRRRKILMWIPRLCYKLQPDPRLRIRVCREPDGVLRLRTRIPKKKVDPPIVAEVRPQVRPPHPEPGPRPAQSELV